MGLKEYEPDDIGIHTIRVTFMCWDYVGHIAYQVGGNCRGGSLIDPDFLEMTCQDDIDRFVENDCKFTFDEDEEIYRATLRNSEGDELEVEENDVAFEDMIIAIEIVDFKSDGDNED